MQVQFDPTATRAFSARTLRRFIEGPIAILILVICIGTVAFEDYREQTWTHIVVGILLLGFAYIVIQRFISDMLENDNRKALSKKNSACLLTYNVLHKLPNKVKTSYELLEAVTKTDRGKFILHEMGLDRDHLLEIAKQEIAQENIVPFLGEAAANMQRFGVRKMDADVVLYTFFQRKGAPEQLLNSLDLSLGDMEMIVKWEDYHAAVWHKDKLLSPASLTKTFGGMGRKWVTGFNDVLDGITEDISQNILYRGEHKVTIHLDKLKDAMHILGRSSQHNIIITGDDGCGKQTFVGNIAYQLRLQESQKGYAYTHVLKLKAQDLLSGEIDPDAVLLQALKRADKQGHYILVIENIGLFLESGDAKIAGVLSKFLQTKNINIIGIADTKDYHRYIKTNPALESQFEVLSLDPTSFADTTSVVMEEYFSIEDRQHTHVTYKAIKAIVELADRYVTKGAFPGKAIDLLYDAVANAKDAKAEFVTEDNVREMISLRAHMDVTGSDEKKKDVLRNLEEGMAKEVVGQRSALAAISNALKRASADITNRKKPIGTFLFLGPTGVGKTQTAKTLAKHYFGSEENMIRMDMNEYGNEDSVSMVIGSTDSRYPSEGFLTRAVQDKPFSLILLDEIEKADKKVLNLFLQILDEGHLIDGQGVKTDFRNAIIIATSNAGAQCIVEFLKNHPEPDHNLFKKELLDELIKSGKYSPEFLNRFDDVILYQPLTRDETVRVASLMIGSVIKELEAGKGIAIQIDDDAVAAIAEKGHSTEFGAREMKRAITDTLETYVADYMLENDVQRGAVLKITRGDLKL
ncbi:MAG: AAA family ATPase [Candidatus Peribacteraceae bacterium]|jgi:ATP-dependent Clp protease ATP-binding subunit ClpA|nr:AAA family ATPase [Candidatus Peribacteraceae bacterium]